MKMEIVGRYSFLPSTLLNSLNAARICGTSLSNTLSIKPYIKKGVVTKETKQKASRTYLAHTVSINENPVRKPPIILLLINLQSFNHHVL